MAEIKDKVVTLESLKYVHDSLDGTKVPITRTVNGKELSVDISITADDVGAEAIGTVSTHDAATDSHSDIRNLITGLTLRLNTLADSDDATLDQMSELVAYIKSNKNLIEEITTKKVNVSDIIDDLTTSTPAKPLSAAQGVALKGLIDTLDNDKIDSSSLELAINAAFAEAKTSGEFDEIYIGDGPIPESATIQILMDGSDEEQALKEELIEYIDGELATELAKRGQLKPEFANNIEECTDTSKFYVLPDGYIYAYGKSTKNIVENQFIASEATLNARVRGNGQIQTGYNGLFATGKITIPSFVNPYVVKMRGATLVWHTATSKAMSITYYNSSDEVLGGNASLGGTNVGIIQPNEQGEYEVDIYNNSYTDVAYVRFDIAISNSAISASDTANIFIEFIPKNTTEIVEEWMNTGHAFVPADYEDRIIELEEDVLTLKNEIEAGGGNSSETVTIPSYWKSMVESKTETIKALQEVGGKDCVCFAWAADTHIPDNSGGRTTDIGKVMAKMLDNCEIPFAMLSGDINTRASFDTEEKLINAQAQLPVHLAPLWGTDRLLMALGNHDGCWGDSTAYYRHQFAPERMWQIFFRSQALDFRRVFSDDGLYYYVDNIPQKTRFIVLNSHFGGEYAEDENGLAVNNRFGTSCYGQTQLDWLANTALDMPEGYGAIITAHVPPNITYTVDKKQFIGIVNAYNNKTTYSGSFAGVDGWTSSNVSVDFTGAKGKIIAMFTGHVHGDSIDTTTMACPILTILSAGATPNEPYAEEAPTRTFGTDTETSFDVVTINKKTRTIYCTRVGGGNDRSTSY